MLRYTYISCLVLNNHVRIYLGLVSSLLRGNFSEVLVSNCRPSWCPSVDEYHTKKQGFLQGMCFAVNFHKTYDLSSGFEIMVLFLIGFLFSVSVSAFADSCRTEL